MQVSFFFTQIAESCKTWRIIGRLFANNSAHLRRPDVLAFIMDRWNWWCR